MTASRPRIEVQVTAKSKKGSRSTCRYRKETPRATARPKPKINARRWYRSPRKSLNQEVLPFWLVL